MSSARLDDAPDGRELPAAFARLRPRDFTTEALCTGILERHRDSVSVRKEERAIANLSRIVEAVLKLSSRRSFHEMTLRELAETSGLSMGGLYSYFDTKLTLLTMILTEVALTTERVLGAPPEGVADDPRRHLRWLIDTHLRLTDAMQRWFAFAYLEAKGFPEPARQIAVDSELATEAVFARALAEGRRRGVFLIDDVELTAALIKPLLQDWYVKHGKHRRRGTTLDGYVAGVTAFVERSILRA